MNHTHTAKGKHLEEIWEQVPPDYYQHGVQKNILQRMWHTNKLREVSAAIKETKKSPQNILDVGSASGWFLSELSKKFPKARCTGIDVYDEAIAYGKQQYKHITLRKADGHTLPFKKNSFDVVVCCEVLEHVVDPDKVMQQIRKVVTPKGIVIIEIDSGNWLFKVVWFWWTTLRRGVWRDAHLHPFNIHMLEEIFIRNGFRIKKKKIFNIGMAVIFILDPHKHNK